MMLIHRCPRCNAAMELPEEKLGRYVTCQGCGAFVKAEQQEQNTELTGLIYRCERCGAGMELPEEKIDRYVTCQSCGSFAKATVPEEPAPPVETENVPAEPDALRKTAESSEAAPSQEETRPQQTEPPEDEPEAEAPPAVDETDTEPEESEPAATPEPLASEEPTVEGISIMDEQAETRRELLEEESEPAEEQETQAGAESKDSTETEQDDFEPLSAVTREKAPELPPTEPPVPPESPEPPVAPAGWPAADDESPVPHTPPPPPPPRRDKEQEQPGFATVEPPAIPGLDYHVLPAPGASAAVVWGVLALLCCGPVFGIIAISSAQRAKECIKAAPANYSGEEMANAGLTLGVIGLIVNTLGWVAIFFGAID